MAEQTPVMKVRTYLARMFPGAFTALSLLILPLVLTGYYAISRLSDKVATDQNLNFEEFQDNFLALFLFSKGWVLWFNEALDFILWGAVAAIILVVIWAVSATRVAVDNHKAQTQFKHFQVDAGTWHSQFLIMAVIKLLIVLIGIFCAILILVHGIPQLGLSVERAVQEFTAETLKQALLAGLTLFVLQYVIATCIRLLTHLRTDG